MFASSSHIWPLPSTFTVNSLSLSLSLSASVLPSLHRLHTKVCVCFRDRGRTNAFSIVCQPHFAIIDDVSLEFDLITTLTLFSGSLSGVNWGLLADMNSWNDRFFEKNTNQKYQIMLKRILTCLELHDVVRFFHLTACKRRKLMLKSNQVPVWLTAHGLDKQSTKKKTSDFFLSCTHSFLVGRVSSRLPRVGETARAKAALTNYGKNRQHIHNQRKEKNAYAFSFLGLFNNSGEMQKVRIFSFSRKCFENVWFPRHRQGCTCCSSNGATRFPAEVDEHHCRRHQSRCSSCNCCWLHSRLDMPALATHKIREKERNEMTWREEI